MDVEWGGSNALVCAEMRVKGSDAACPVESLPALQGPCRDPSFTGENGERDLDFDMQPKNIPPLGRIHESPTRGSPRAPGAPVGGGRGWHGSSRRASLRLPRSGPSPSLPSPASAFPPPPPDPTHPRPPP